MYSVNGVAHCQMQCYRHRSTVETATRPQACYARVSGGGLARRISAYLLTTTQWKTTVLMVFVTRYSRCCRRQHHLRALQPQLHYLLHRRHRRCRLPCPRTFHRFHLRSTSWEHYPDR